MLVTLSIITFLLPIAGAAGVWLAGSKREPVQYRIAAGTLGLTGLAAIIVLFLPRVGLLSGALKGEVQLISLVTVFALAVAGLGGGYGVWRASSRGLARPGGFFVFSLAFVGGVSMMALAQNLLLILIGWGVIVFTIYRMITFDDWHRAAQADTAERIDRDRYDIL